MRLLALVLVAVLSAVPARAATVEQIVALARAGVSDSVILALIDRDKTIFSLDSDQLVMLKREGVSEPIVLAMLKSGRAEADAAVRAETEMRAANIAATTPPTPDVVIVGHEPDVPNGSAERGFAQEAPPPPYAVPFAVPYAVPIAPYASRGHRGVHAAGRTGGRSARPPSADEALCVATVTAGPSPTSRGVGFVTVCPDSMQLHTRPR